MSNMSGRQIFRCVHCLTKSLIGGLIIFILLIFAVYLCSVTLTVRGIFDILSSLSWSVTITYMFFFFLTEIKFVFIPLWLPRIVQVLMLIFLFSKWFAKEQFLMLFTRRCGAASETGFQSGIFWNRNLLSRCVNWQAECQWGWRLR